VDTPAPCVEDGVGGAVASTPDMVCACKGFNEKGGSNERSATEEVSDRGGDGTGMQKGDDGYSGRDSNSHTVIARLASGINS
jgi:hypothetical protein